MRKITRAGAACRLMMVVIGATLATSAIGLRPAEAAKSYQVNGKWYSVHGASGYDESGTASHHGPGFHGRRPANGETYDQWGMTAAHKTLPLGSHVYVTNQRTGKTVKVRINDRGPFVGGRIIDLSTHVAGVLGINGLGQVRVRTAMSGGDDQSERRKIASKAKQDDDGDDTPKRKAKARVASNSDGDDAPKRKAKVRVASNSDDEDAKPRKAASQKADSDKTEARAKDAAKERRERYKHEVREYGGMASLSGGDAGKIGPGYSAGWKVEDQRLVQKLEQVAMAEVQAEWRKAVASRKS